MKFLLLSTILWMVLAISCGDKKKVQRVENSHEQLIQTIRDSIEKDPGDKRLKYNLAVVLQDAGRYQEALAALDSMKVDSVDPADPYVYYNYLFKRSELLELTGDTTNAIATLEELVRPGELTQAGIRLVNLYAETKNPKTIPFADSMLANDQEGYAPEPNYFKGIYYFNKGDYRRAIAEFEQSIQKDYNFMDAHLEKGISYYQLGEHVEAIRTFDMALKISITFADAYFWKGKAQEALGQFEEARLNYERAYSLDQELREERSGK